MSCPEKLSSPGVATGPCAANAGLQGFAGGLICPCDGLDYFPRPVVRVPKSGGTAAKFIACSYSINDL
jgi:hypothetical protein